MSAPRLTADQKGAIVAEYVAGVKVEAIAASYRVHSSYPGLLAKRRGLRQRPIGRPGRAA